MKVGDLVKNKLRGADSPIGMIVEIKKMSVEDVYCNHWGYPDYIRVMYSNGDIEFNPAALYELISEN